LRAAAAAGLLLLVLTLTTIAQAYFNSIVISL